MAYIYMTTYLDMLPDELYQMIYSQIKQICVQQAATIGARRNRFTHVPNRRTNDSVIYHWLRDKPEKANILWPPRGRSKLRRRLTQPLAHA